MKCGGCDLVKDDENLTGQNSIDLRKGQNLKCGIN
jgi:ribulose 1,5-bisphosphate carboxylase large subunit-like protein